jgi:2-oxoisovalerate dehydrogenase E1 component
LTEEQQNNSFAEALAGRISSHCFQQLDAPVAVLGALNVPALPINTLLEGAMLPGPDKIKSILEALLSF